MGWSTKKTILNGKRYSTNYRTEKKSEAKKKANSIRNSGRNAIIREEGSYYVVYTKQS